MPTAVDHNRELGNEFLIKGKYFDESVYGYIN